LWQEPKEMDGKIDLLRKRRNICIHAKKEEERIKVSLIEEREL